MLTLSDINTIETDEDATEEEYFCSLQRAINSNAWSLQGSYGRAMMNAIESGRCVLGPTPARDYWGNRIPSRTEVQEGTKGSIEFVRNECGDEWVEMILSV